MGSKLNHLVRDPILFVGCPGRTTADLVRGRVVKGLSLSTMHNVQGTVYMCRELSTCDRGVFCERSGMEGTLRVVGGEILWEEWGVVLGVLGIAQQRPGEKPLADTQVPLC